MNYIERRDTVGTHLAWGDEEKWILWMFSKQSEKEKTLKSQ